MKYIICLAISLNSLSVHAQKLIQNEILAQDISTVQIDGNKIYKIETSTHHSDFIFYSASHEGESAENFTIVPQLNNHTLSISAIFQPFQQPLDDKLSAHKVISIHLVLYLPDGLQLNIQSQNSHINVSGNYSNIKIETTNGICNLEDFNGNANIETIHGNINVATKGARVRAETKNGLLDIAKFPIGKNRIDLKSLNGNIVVSKTE